MSHFQEKIEASQKKLDELRGLVAEMVGMAEAEERDLSDDETLQLEAYATDIEAQDKRVANLELAEKAMAARVVEQQAPNLVKRVGTQERKPGEIIFKQATAAYLAHMQKRNILEVAKEVFPRDEGLQCVIRSVVEPAATDVATWAAELTEEATMGYLDLLRGSSIAAQLWTAAGMNLAFDGYTAINIPSRQGTTTDLATGWVGERQAIKLAKAEFGTQKLEPFKRAAIVTMSKEIMMRSTPALMGIIQQGLITDSATALDNDFLSSQLAVAGLRPAGIYQGVTGTAASTGGATTGDDMLTDLRNLLQPIYNLNMGQNLRIVMHPQNALAMSLVLYNGTYLFRDELARGAIFSVPVIQSTNAPLDELLALDMAHVAVGNGGSTVSVSDTATIVEVNEDGVQPDMSADTYPRSPNTGQVGDAAGTTPASPVRSLFQTETVAVKQVTYQSWARLRDGCVNRITGVAY